MTRHHILIIEDDPAIRNVMLDKLSAEGYSVESAAFITAGMDKLAVKKPDLLVLDLNLPDGDGLDVCKKLASGPGAIPVMMVTARGSSDDIVEGLEAGAQDYLVKPFKVQEFLARVRAIVRRSPPRELSGEELESGKIRISEDTHEVWCDGETVRVTLREYEILHALVSHEGKALSREFILSLTQGAINISERVVDVHISHLRGKLGAEGKRLETVSQVGFKMVIAGK